MSQKNLGLDIFIAELKEELTPILFKLLHYIETKEIFTNSFYEINITLLQKHSTKNKKNYVNNSYEHICKSSQ